jgi:hypothetical protein
MQQGGGPKDNRLGLNLRKQQGGKYGIAERQNLRNLNMRKVT